MAIATVTTDVQLVGAGLNLDILPPVGEDQEVTDIGSSVWVGVVPNTRPQVDVGIFDGALGPSHILRSTDVRGWYRKQRILLSRTNYLRLNNPGGAGANISFSAKIIRRYGTGVSIVLTDVQAIGAGLVLSIQPPAGQDWRITEFGSDQWIGAGVAGLPNLLIQITDGVLVATLMQSTDTRQWDAELDLPVTNANYVDVTNTAGVLANVSFSAELIRNYGTGPSIVRSDVLACVGGASVDFIPPLGEEWKVTGIAGATWVGGAPLAFPDLTAHIFNGILAGQIQVQTCWNKQGNPFEIMIDNANYLRLTDTSGIAQSVGIAAEVVLQNV